MNKKFFYLLTFILCGLIACEKTDSPEVLTQYSQENYREFGTIPQTTNLCCSDELPIILDIDSTPLSGQIWTYSCNYYITSVDWTIKDSNRTVLATGNSVSYSNSFLLSYNEIYSLKINATLAGFDGSFKSEAASFNFIYTTDGFSPTKNTREVSLCTGALGGTITAIMP